jgi:hypothetical protein
MINGSGVLNSFSSSGDKGEVDVGRGGDREKREVSWRVRRCSSIIIDGGGGWVCWFASVIVEGIDVIEWGDGGTSGDESEIIDVKTPLEWRVSFVKHVGRRYGK